MLCINFLIVEGAMAPAQPPVPQLSTHVPGAHLSREVMPQPIWVRPAGRPAGRRSMGRAGGPGRAIDELKGGERDPGCDRDETGGSMRELWRICACRPRYLRPARCDPVPGAARSEDRAAARPGAVRCRPCSAAGGGARRKSAHHSPA